MDAGRLAIVARDVGVRYDLRMSHRRTLRQALADAAGRSAPTLDGPTSFWALRDVTFVAEKGDVVAVVGRNGSGKTTLLMAIAGILRPDTGVVRAFGRSSLLTIGAGFEPDLTGRENIYLNAALLGLTRPWIDRRIRAIIRFSELGQFIDVPLRKYSNGMRARLGFSIAVHTEPDLLLIDEVLGVGDEGFQQKSQQKLRELMAHARAIVVVSHSMAFVREMCTKALWLDEGRVAAWGAVDDVVDQYVASSERQHGTVVRTIG